MHEVIYKTFKSKPKYKLYIERLYTKLCTRLCTELGPVILLDWTGVDVTPKSTP